MIVKDEAHCIARCLESVKPFITYWIICDTGSSDNTEEVVKECLKDIPGEFHKHEWKDFATNRNLAIELSKDKANYTLIIDADDFLVTNENSFKNLYALAYRIKIIHANLVHYRPQLIHNSVDYKYIGVIHEYLELPPYVNQQILPDCEMIISRDGTRSQLPNKYLRDAEVLEKALESDPNNSRYVFYCAQSYRDCGNLEKSLHYYLKRADMPGFREENYCSLVEAGKIMTALNPKNLHDITIAYLKAFEINSNRAESLYYLSLYYRSLNLFGGAYTFAKMASLIPKPAEALFIETELYNWKILDELAISAYYVGKKDECKIINEHLLLSGILPDYEVQRIVTNLSFCK